MPRAVFSARLSTTLLTEFGKLVEKFSESGVKRVITVFKTRVVIYTAVSSSVA